MALIDSCLIHHKLESAGNSEIGINPTETGTTTYSAAKFNNGLDTDVDGRYLSWTNALTNTDKGSLSVWVKIGFDSTDSTYRILLGTPDDSIQFLFWLNTTLGWYIYFGSTIYNCTPGNFGAFSTGDIFNITIKWDAGAGAGNRVKIYRDGVEKTITSVVDGDWSPLGTKTLTTKQFGGAGGGTVDNIKLFDDTADIADVLANINTEGFPSVPDAVTGVSATDGTYTNQINITWNASATATGYKLYKSSTGGSYTLLLTTTGLSYSDPAVVSGQIYYYYVIAYNGVGDASQSNIDTGYAQEIIYPFIPEQPKVKILFEGIDLLAEGYVDKLMKVSYSKTFQRDKILINEITLEVKNYDDYFSIYKSSSIFKNIVWLYDNFQIYDMDENFIWNGIIVDIQRNHDTKMASIVSTDKLYQYATQLINYTSADWETPSQAIKNICDLIGFTNYNPLSIQTSTNRYASKNCYIKCYFDYADNITFQDALEKIADIGCCDVYCYKNLLYVNHYWPYTGNAKITLNETDLTSNPKITYLEREIINDYRIGYNGDGGSPVVDSARGSLSLGQYSRAKYGTLLLPEYTTREGSQIVVKDITSAIYIGDCYIKRTQYNYLNPQPLMKLEFDIKWSNRWDMDLNTVFKLNYEAEGFVDKVFEVYGLTIDYNKNALHIVAYEVEE